MTESRLIERLYRPAAWKAHRRGGEYGRLLEVDSRGTVLLFNTTLLIFAAFLVLFFTLPLPQHHAQAAQVSGGTAGSLTIIVPYPVRPGAASVTISAGHVTCAGSIGATVAEAAPAGASGTIGWRLTIAIEKPCSLADAARGRLSVRYPSQTLAQILLPYLR